MAAIFWTVIAVTAITLVGHGIWALLAFIFGALLGTAKKEGRAPSSTSTEMEDIAAMERQLSRLSQRGLVNSGVRAVLQRATAERRRQLRGLGSRLRGESRETHPAASPAPTTQADTPFAPGDDTAGIEIFDAQVVDEPATPGAKQPAAATPSAPERPPQAEPTKAPAPSAGAPSERTVSTPAASETRRPAETPAASHRTAAPSPVRAPTPPRPATPATPPEPTRPAARPRPPRRSLAEVLAAFMEEKNIRWGELVGGMLIVGGSIALVVSLREQLQSIPYFRFFIFSGVTTALFAVGLYTAHRWKLESTSRALLLISTLLVPLNFLAMAWLSGEGGFGFALASGSGALILFAVLVFHAARIIVPDGKTLTALGVVGNSALLLFLSRWVGRETEPGLVLGLGCLPVACHMAVLGTYLVRLLPQKALEERQVKGLFVFLGTVTFATLAAMGVLVFRTGRAAAVLEPAAPLVPLIAMPVVAGALVAMRRLANTQPAAGLRTGSMAVALTGLVAMLAAVAMAWPNPLGLILVALLNYTGFTFVAFRYRLPGIHGMALGCLGLAYLTGFHWIYGNLATSDGGPPGVVLRQALLSVQSGTVLVGLFVLLAVASDFLSRRWRDHGAWYAGGAGVVGLLSLLLVTYEGLHDTASPIVLRAMIVYAVYGIGCLVMNLRWRRPSVTYPGLGLTIGASLWAFAWFAPGLRAVWPAGLAAETLIMAAVAWWLRTRADLRGATETDTANAALCAQSPWRAFGVPLATTAEIVSWVATGLVVWHGWSQRLADPWSAWHPVTGICLGAAYLALLAATSGPYLGQLAGWMMAGSVVALVGRFTSGSPSANLEMSITLGLTATGTILASVATWIAQRLNLPAHRETVTEPGDAPWYASLATDWLHVGLGTAAFGGLIIGLSTTWSTSAVPHYCALLAAATCFLAAWGYRWEPLSWIGSGLVFTGLAHALVWTYPHLATHPWPTALMIHATIALLAGSLPGRWLGVERGSTTDPTVVATLDSHILKPVRESGVVSSFAAVPVLLGWFTDWAHALPTAIHLFWLAGIWILVAWVRRWRLLFAAGQMALAAGVLFATTSWLVDEPWVNGDARGLLEPWSLQAYGVALGLLSLAWVAVRLALRNNKTPNHLLHGDRWAIDRFVTLALVFAHLTLTAWCVLPGVGREWNLVPGSPSVTTPTPLELHATGGGAWAVVAVLAAALVGSLWSRWRNGEILAAFSLCVTGALLLAGGFADSTATASALRWTLGFAFVFLSATLWLRGRLCDVASSWRANILHDRQSVPSAIAFALIFTAVPVLALTVVALLLQVTGHTFTTVTGSMFARLPMSVSYLVPITLVVLGFVGHALREKSGEFAFSGGLIASGAVVGGYLLEARTIHPVVCVQWFTVASAVWAAAWLIVRQQLDVWREGPHDPRARFLMTFQLALPTVGNLGLLLLALTVLALWGKLPTGSFRAGGFVRETGSLLGWAAFALTAAAWACRRFLRNRPLRPEVVGLLGMGAIGLAACTVARIADARGLAEPWGYITLMMGWAMYALAVVSATWYVAAQKYPGREPPQSLLRSAAIWVRLPAILAVLLGLKGATAHDLALWSAAAIALASVSGAAMAVWRRREGWAFAAGLGANLAASILVIDQVPARGLEGWVNLLQANMLATGAIALLWLGVRRRLYGARELSLTAGPLLGIQVGAGILGQICLLAIPVALVLLDPAESGRDAAAIARPAGWLAWIVAFAATAWYAWQVARNHLLHVIALGLITLGVMAACTHPVGWSTFHLLLVLWSVCSALLLAFGTAVQWQTQKPESANGHVSILARLPFPVPADLLHAWVLGLMSLIVALALRGGWSDPGGPFWSAGATMAVAFMAGAIAILQKSPPMSHLSGLLLCVAGSLLWWHRMPHTVPDFVLANVIALSLGSLVWSLLGLWWFRVWKALRPVDAHPVYPELSATLSVLALAGTVGGALLGDLEVASPFSISGWAAWTALATTAAALCVCLRSIPKATVRTSLFGVGLTAVGLLIHEQPMAPPRVLWAIGWSLAAYTLATSLIDRLIMSNPAARKWLHLDDDDSDWATSWFVTMQAALCVVVIPLSIWISLDSTPFSIRVAGPLAMTALSVAGFLLAGRGHGAMRSAWQLFALGSLALLLAEWGWACWPLAGQSLLEGSVVLMTALGTAAAICGWLSTRRLPEESGWDNTCQTATAAHGVLGFGALVSVLAQEALLYEVGKGTEMALAAALMVAATFVVLMLASLFLALSSRPDPFGLSARGRQAYVYAVEVLIALLCLHFYCTIPELFQMGIFRDYWLFWTMGIAFGGAALAQLFESRGVPVLAEPLRLTALALPVLPAIGFWLPIDTTHSPFLWFLVAVFYGFQAYTQKSAWWGLASAACANLGLWVTWHEWSFPFFTNPQLWLIPPALAALIAEYLNHDRLKSEQSTALRYLAMSVIYVSSTADMFIVGVGNSLVLPLVLAFLSVAGVLAGILLRVRAFLLLGVSFLMVVITTMIWHAAVDLEHTWVWYVSVIVLGIGIIAMFAIFEKRRNDVLATIEKLKTWD